MRVCFLTGEYPPMRGGVGDYTRELALAMQALGVEVGIITSRRAVAEQGAEPTGGPRVYPAVEDWGYRQWAEIGRALDDFRPDVVHIQYQTAAYGMHPAINLLPLQLRRRRPRPLVAVTFHDLKVPYLFPKAGPIRQLPAVVLAWASDLVVVTNEEDAHLLVGEAPDGREETIRLRSRYGGRSLHLIPIGSNIPITPPAGFDRGAWRERMGVDQGEVLLAYFGFLAHAKGVDLLFEAFRQLLKQRPGIKLAMIGGMEGSSDSSNRAYARQIRAMADEPTFRGRVIWTGFTVSSEVSANLQAADICVLPFREGASLRHGTLVAAITHGLPTVTTSLPATQNRAGWRLLPGVVQLVHRHNAYLVQPNDVNALREGIAALMADPGLAEQISLGAREIAPLFGWESIARETLAAYNAIL